MKLRTLPVVKDAGSNSSPSTWFGLRTLSSQRFRIVLAVTLLLLSVGILAVRTVGLDAADGLYGVDFSYWYAAGWDMRRGASPYPQQYLHQPVAAEDFGYKYPPVFGQVMVPLTWLSLAAATQLWVLLQIAAGVLSVWLAARLGGARSSLELLLWSAVATALFLPFFNSIYYGNVSAIQALQVALALSGGTVAGVALTSAILLKSTPLALVPAALSQGGRLTAALVVSGLFVAGLSILAAPHAWLDFIRIQPNLLFGSNLTHAGIQPASLALLAFPDSPQLAGLIRAATIAVAIVALIGSVRAARSEGGWPAAVVLGVTALLLIPGALWYHYLAVLLPIAAFVWARANARQRAGLLAGAVFISLTSLFAPLATIGAAVLIGVALHVLMPRSASSREQRPVAP